MGKRSVSASDGNFKNIWKIRKQFITFGILKNLEMEGALAV